MSQQTSQVQKKIGDYVFQEILGKGQFGIVYLAKSLMNNHEFAIKQISKTKLNQRQLVRFQSEKEIGLLLFQHPNIVEVFEVIQSTNNFYIVTEFCNSGDLRSYLNQSNGVIEESVFQQFAAQIVNSLELLYQKQIIHRDLKPENILIHKINGYQLIKIADLGLSIKMDKDQMAKTMCGTPLYASPQVLNGDQYNYKTDL